MASIRKIYTQSEELNRVQDAIIETVQPILNDKFLQRQTYTLTIGTSGTTFKHNLKRVPLGFIVIDKPVATDVYRTAWNDTSATLTATVAAEVTIFLF
jgi:hypothetical protein